MTGLRQVVRSAVALSVFALTVAANPASGQVMDQARYLFLFADNFEQAPGLSGSPVRLEGDAWYGGSYNRLWVKVDGDAELDGTEGEMEVQALFSRLVAPYWDAQIGIQVDRAWGGGTQTRSHLALGLQGLAPYWFEVEAAVLLSTGGDIQANLQASYEILFTQRLILEPEIELNVSFQDQPRWGMASGLTDTEIGLRLRYEFRREFAPYVGYVWQRSYGGTTDMRRASAEPWRQGSLVAGLRMWY